MLIKRALKERDLYRIANHNLPELQDVEDVAVFWIGDVIRITCTEHYPFRSPNVDVMLSGELVPYKSLPKNIHLKDYDALLLCKLARPELFAPLRWPNIEKCPCCTSLICHANWCTSTHMHEIAAECIFWMTYMESRDLLSSTSLRELPRDILHHMLSLV